MAAINRDPENAALSAAAVERQAPELPSVGEREDCQFGITLDGRDRCGNLTALLFYRVTGVPFLPKMDR